MPDVQVTRAGFLAYWYNRRRKRLRKRTVPGAFVGADWSVADAGGGAGVIITIANLPSDGGSQITDLEASVDGGDWVNIGGTTLGGYTVAAPLGELIGVVIRAVNVIGAGAASNSEAVTPT